MKKASPGSPYNRLTYGSRLCLYQVLRFSWLVYMFSFTTPDLSYHRFIEKVECQTVAAAELILTYIFRTETVDTDSDGVQTVQTSQRNSACPIYCSRSVGSKEEENVHVRRKG